ncbi:MAG: endonuclease [Flavobacteriales bacterium]|nr:endonuclease [Flavobacteriales bacterium]
MQGPIRLFRYGWIGLALSASAQIPPGYYDNAAGLSGDDLRTALYNIIKGHTVMSYSSLWSFFPTTDQRPDGFVWDVYSDLPGGVPAYLYAFGTDQCGTYNGEGDCYNREHSFPKSWFNDGQPMESDLHHIYPTDAWVNQKRGNHPFGEVGSPDWVGTNGTKVGMNVFPGYGGTVFEPIDAYKGDLARTYFYMLTRYEPFIQNWSSPMLQFDDLTTWAEAMLLQWHLDDPVSGKEEDRNNAIYGIQNNRNPFIDHPEWAEFIWGPTATIQEMPQPQWQVISREEGIWIAHPDLNEGVVEVFDPAGRRVLGFAWNGSSRTVRLPDQGVWTLILRSSSSVEVRRIVR